MALPTARSWARVTDDAADLGFCDVAQIATSKLDFDARYRR
jgi:hypothetical protein